LAVSSCINTIDRLREVGKVPQLSHVYYPQERNYHSNHYQQAPNNDLNYNTEAKVSKNSNNSLWKTGSRNFFRDQNARNIGDIIKVLIKINDKADLKNRSEQRRNNNESLGVPNLFGLQSKMTEMFPDGTNLSSLVGVNGANSHNGEGKIARKESLQTQIAATVRQILPNGSLIIHGHQEVRVNYEVREITIDGIVRPDDISSENSISLEQIAEARVSYGGRGHISNVQQPRGGYQLLDILSPF
jgi:flagellar L-ring protein precursor FlgH